jgi:hypothetical protein
MIDTMSTNPFVAQRWRLEASDRLASVVATLPFELRETNAVPLLGIVTELGASSVIEIGVIHAVTRVNVEDPRAIKAQREILEDYRDRRLYDRDRTHCSNIKRISTQLRSADETAQAVQELQRLDQELVPLQEVDDDLIGDIERILDEAITAITEIEKHRRLDDARDTQVRFAERMQPTIADIKGNLRRMNEVTRKLIDEM